MKIIPLIAAVALSSTAFAQSATHTSRPSTTNANNPCNLASPSTVNSCWACFQNLLSNCDQGNPTDDRRQACYEGANNFFTWCLGRINDEDSDTNGQIDRDEVFDLRSTMHYEVFVPTGTEASDISVTIRYFDGYQSRQADLNENELFVFEETGIDNVFLIVLNPAFDVSTSNSIGIVTRFQNNSGFAFSADVVDSFDVNGDGVFNSFDRIEAMQKFANGDLSHQDLTRILLD